MRSDSVRFPAFCHKIYNLNPEYQNNKAKYCIALIKFSNMQRILSQAAACGQNMGFQASRVMDLPVLYIQVTIGSTSGLIE